MKRVLEKNDVFNMWLFYPKGSETNLAEENCNMKHVVDRIQTYNVMFIVMVSLETNKIINHRDMNYDER